MARSKSDAECMICGEAPCICGKPRKPASTTQSKLPKASLPSAPPAPPRPPVALPQAVAVKPPVQKAVTTRLENFVSDDEMEMRRALTVIAEEELLGPDDLRTHRGRFNLPPWKIDALIWKAETTWQCP